MTVFFFYIYLEIEVHNVMFLDVLCIDKYIEYSPTLIKYLEVKMHHVRFFGSNAAKILLH